MMNYSKDLKSQTRLKGRRYSLQSTIWSMSPVTKNHLRKSQKEGKVTIVVAEVVSKEEEVISILRRKKRGFMMQSLREEEVTTVAEVGPEVVAEEEDEELTISLHMKKKRNFMMKGLREEELTTVVVEEVISPLMKKERSKKKPPLSKLSIISAIKILKKTSFYEIKSVLVMMVILKLAFC